MTDYDNGFNNGLIAGISSKGFVKQTVHDSLLIIGKIKEIGSQDITPLNGVIVDGILGQFEITEVV